MDKKTIVTKTIITKEEFEDDLYLFLNTIFYTLKKPKVKKRKFIVKVDNKYIKIIKKKSRNFFDKLVLTKENTQIRKMDNYELFWALSWIYQGMGNRNHNYKKIFIFE